MLKPLQTTGITMMPYQSKTMPKQASTMPMQVSATQSSLDINAIINSMLPIIIMVMMMGMMSKAMG